MTLADPLQSARRRRFQFSLQTLLLAVCAVAVLFGIVLPLANWAFIVEMERQETELRKETPQFDVFLFDIESIAILFFSLALLSCSIAAVRRFNARNDG